MTGFATALGAAIAATRCGVLSASDYVLGAVGGAGVVNTDGALAAVNAARRLGGCIPANDPEPPPPEFTGGQCAVTYNCSVTYTLATAGCGTLGPFTDSIPGVPGPLSTRFTHDTAASGPVGGLCPGFSKNKWELLVTAGVFATRSSPRGITISSFTATRADGQPDDCGDIPSVFPPPINIDIDVNFDYTDEGDNIVNVTIPITYSPFNFDFNGNIRAPFSFNFGGSNFTGSATFSPRVTVDINSPSQPPSAVDPPTSPSEPPEEVVYPPRGDKVQGVIVVATINSDSEVSSIEGDVVPDLFVPRLGSVKFAYSFGISTVWSNDIDVKGTAVFIPCPWHQGASAVQANPTQGVSFSLTAITGPPVALVTDLVPPP